jgi:3-phosphoshikimate 1-carboxyvinyltransferase
MSKISIYKSTSNGRIILPSSKSDAHRKIICASLCVGEKSILTNVNLSNDINATIECMRTLGAEIEYKNNTLFIRGISDFTPREEVILDANESGSTLRFLIPIASLLAKKVIFKGSQKLLSRPLTPYQDIYKNHMVIKENSIVINAPLKPRQYSLPGDISSQFISGLLFALPLLKRDSNILIFGEYESESYVKMTLDTLAEYGLQIKYNRSLYHPELIIKGRQSYKAHNSSIEGDCSQLAFLGALGLINNDVIVSNIPKETKQGDKAIIEYFKKIGGNIEKIDDTTYLFKKSELIGGILDLADTPDLGPLLMAIGSYCKEGLVLENTRRLRFKESDRASAMKEELIKFGAKIIVEDNRIIIPNSILQTPKEIINPHNDHRIIMALSIIASLYDKTTFDNKECVNKSYPGFFDDLKELDIKEEVTHD